MATVDIPSIKDYSSVATVDNLSITNYSSMAMVDNPSMRDYPPLCYKAKSSVKGISESVFIVHLLAVYHLL